VQSVAVRLIVEREREINQFKTLSHFKIEALLTATDSNNRAISFKAEDGKKA
jgi:DNA topoisomerase-1